MNKDEKSVVLFLLSVFILVVIFVPLKVQAKTFVIGSSIYSAWQDDFDIIEPGDILDFSNCSSSIKYDLFLDGEKESECYGNKPECNKTQYIVKDRMVFGYAEYEYQIESMYFYKLSPDQELLIYDDSTPDGYYKSGDVFVFLTEKTGPHEMGLFIYNDDDDLLYYSDYSPYRTLSYKLPKIKGKDVYWKLESFVTPGNYIYGECPHFRPFDYDEPKIELICDKDKIKYGEKASCEVCLECTHALSKLEFSMTQSDLKFSNFGYSSGITNVGNEQSIKLNISDNNLCTAKKTLMTFDVEGTKDNTYLDKITLRNVEFTDEILSGNYKDLDSNLNVISTKETISNPKTGIKLLFIIIPILLLIIVGTISLFIKKKKATN